MFRWKFWPNRNVLLLYLHYGIRDVIILSFLVPRKRRWYNRLPPSIEQNWWGNPNRNEFEMERWETKIMLRVKAWDSNAARQRFYASSQPLCTSFLALGHVKALLKAQERVEQQHTARGFNVKDVFPCSNQDWWRSNMADVIATTTVRVICNIVSLSFDWPGSMIIELPKCERESGSSFKCGSAAIPSLISVNSIVMEASERERSSPKVHKSKEWEISIFPLDMMQIMQSKFWINI